MPLLSARQGNAEWQRIAVGLLRATAEINTSVPAAAGSQLPAEVCPYGPGL